LHLQLTTMSFTEKQLQIIAAAEKLFANRGFDGTSVRDIAEEAGVNIAMISYYFGSKEKLMQALFSERTGHIRLKVESLLQDDSLTPLEKIYVLADDYIERIMKKQQFHKIMFYEQMMEKNSVITEMLAELKKENTGHVTRLIKDGQKRGAFRKDIDIVLLMNVLFGTVTQTFMNQKYYRDYYNLESLSDEALRDRLKKKLSNHIKTIFKALLTYEA
jgi:AcrR family transcriptional regulator